MITWELKSQIPLSVTSIDACCDFLPECSFKSNQMQSHQYPAMLHKTLFMAVWLFFLFFLLFPLSFPLSLIPLSLNINLLFDFPTSISKHVPKQLHWVIRSFKSMRIRTVCWFLWGSRSPNRERLLQRPLQAMPNLNCILIRAHLK